MSGMRAKQVVRIDRSSLHFIMRLWLAAGFVCGLLLGWALWG